MKENFKRLANIFVLFTLLLAVRGQAAGNLGGAHNYLVGRGITDITGPAWGVQMWGFSYDGQLTEGIHIRQKSRAFVIAENNGEGRLVFASVDIGSIEHNITLEVVDRLQSRYGDTYTLANVILSATHTHAAPAGYWHNRFDLGLAGPFYQEYFDSIVRGIVASIEMAHGNIQPASIFIDTGDVEGAGINRSLIAYEQNPKEERDKYTATIDKEMTLLKLSTDSGDIGMINWHAVHPTSMTYYNRLISGDHKGYASGIFEREMYQAADTAPPFVAAFAQANPGDVTPNLNLDNTGPGENDFESTRIIGDRQLSVARRLFNEASEQLVGKIDYRQVYVDLSNFEVADTFTRSGPKHTCPSAYGYSFAGGSTEDGGGHFLFEEGMTEQSIIYDFLIKILTGIGPYTPEVKKCQTPKAILWQTGTGNPPLQSQIRSISVARIGQLVLIAVPAEVTTMAGRRLRNTVMAQLGDWAKYAVIAGYSNGYAGYVTTSEEYRLQQYEGGHTLHGQWTLGAYEQTSSELALALEHNDKIAQTIEYDDWRGKTTSTPLISNEADVLPEEVGFGEAMALESTHFSKGEKVTATFWSSDPSANFGFQGHYLEIQRKEDNIWVTVYTDDDWATKIQWQPESGAYLAQVTWDIHNEARLGIYRIKHSGQFTSAKGKKLGFEGESALFFVE